MIQLNFTLWELAIFIVAVAFVIGTIYLIKVLKSLSATLENSGKLIDESRAPVHVILENMEDISGNANAMSDKANDMLGEAQGTVTQLKSDVVEPLIGAASTVAKVMKALSKTESKRKKLK